MPKFLLFFRKSADHIVSEEGLQSFRDADTFLALVVLKERSHDARESQRRAVERVAEHHFLVLRTAVTTFQTIGLIGVEITRRAYLQPTVLRLAIDLEVLADRRRERHITA